MSSWWNVCGAAGLSCALGLAACGGPSTARAQPRVAAHIRVTPNRVVLAAGGEVQLSAEVNDSRGTPIGGAEITFRSSDPSKVFVSPNGFVQSEGATGQAQIVVSSGVKQTTVPIQIKAGPAHTMQSVSGDHQSATVGTLVPQQLVVRVLDDKGNLVPGAEVTFTPGDGGAADPAAEGTDAQGEATSRWRLGPQPGAQVLAAAIKTASSAATTFTAQAKTGPPAKLLGRREALTGAAGEAIEVSVTDAEGNAKSGAAVRWHVDRGGGKLSSNSSTTDESGVARVVLTRGKGRKSKVIARVGALVTTMDVAWE